MPFSLKDYSSLEKAGPAGEPGLVYSAIQRSQNRKVAIKKIVLSDPVDFTLITGLKHEILSSGVLDHPNIIRVYNFGEDSGFFYIAMEYIDGYSLEDILFWRPFSKEITLIIILHALRGIWFAHKKNIAHCNLKPANILVSKAGKVVITDFGISNALIHSIKRTALNKPEQSFSTYMPPEQAEYTHEQLTRLMQTADDIPVFSDQQPASEVCNHDFDFKKDIWSIGVILYRMLTEAPPFSGGDKTGQEQSTQHEKELDIPDKLRLFPSDLVVAIASCLALDPVKRADSLEPLILALQNFLNDFGLQKSANELQQYLADKTAFHAEVEKKATDYHIRKGKEFLAQGNIQKSNAHFDAAKNIVFDPSKNDQPITLFPVEPRKNSDDRNNGGHIAESIANLAAPVKKVIRTKMFLKVVGALAIVLAGIIALPLLISTIKHAGPKNEAFITDIPGTAPPGKKPEPFMPKPAKSFPGNHSLSQSSPSSQSAAAGRDPSRSDTPIPAPGSTAGDSNPVDSFALGKINDSTQPGLPSFGTLIASIEPPTAYIFIDKAGVPKEELTVGKYLRTGSHFISALANGYQSYKGEFVIEKDSVAKLSIILKKAAPNGSLHVYSKPSAELYIDGSFQGSAPTLNLILIQSGDHALQLRRKGYKTHIETVSIAAGEEKRLQIELEKE